MVTTQLPESEDSYLASLSDLMVGLLFIFIIILMAFALNLREAETEKDVQTQDLLKEKQQLEAIVEYLTSNNSVRQTILAKIQQSLREEGTQVFVDMKNGILRLPEELLFATGEANFRPAGQKTLKELAQVLAEILPCYTIVPLNAVSISCDKPSTARLDAVFIEGHTDNRPIRNQEFADNWALASARAINTYQALVKYAPSLDNLQNMQRQSVLSVSAYEARRPVAETDTEFGRRKNRRIDLRFLMSSPPPALIDEAKDKLKK